jgi:hypothetical protein
MAAWQIAVYRQMRDHNQEIERAYLGLTHKGGLILRGNEASFQLWLVNNGNTPGDVLEGRVRIASGKKEPGAQLVPLTQIVSFPPALLRPTGHLQVADTITLRKEIRADETLWLIGEVHYRDRFGRFHRAGYGRGYEPTSAGNNLVFDDTTNGMNYDRPLTRRKRKAKGYPNPPATVIPGER